MRRLVRFVCLLSGLVIVPSTVYAQASIAGVVKDASGAVLPGVTVEAASPALLEKVRTVVTDGSGQYKIEALRPGTYAVTFALAGFTTVKREGVELLGTFTAQINAEMRVGELNETITVTGETPIVDVQNTKQQYVIGQELMRSLPSSGNLQSIASLLPSVTRGTIDVGGLLGESGSATGSMTTHGNGDVRTEVGGISVHATQGSGTNGLGNGAAYQEMQVDTSGVSAEQKEGGIRINMVPRDGGNTFQAHFLTAFSNQSMQGSNITQELRDRGFIAPNSLNKYVEANPSGGGPILRDRIWFYGTARYNRAMDNAPIFFNVNAGDPNSWTYVPDVARGNAHNDNIWKSGNGRVAWQATAKNKIGVSYDYASSCPCPRSLTATTSPESNVSNYAPIKPGTMLFLDWTAPLTNRVLIEAGFMKRDSQSNRPLTNIYFTQDPGGRLLNAVNEQSTGLRYRASSSVATSSQNPTRQPRMSVSYITGAHALKTGVNLTFQNNRQKSYSIDSPLSFRFNNGVPNQMTLLATPFKTAINELDHGAFIQDRWTVKRITVTGGLRFDYFKVSFPAQGVGPAPLAPNRSFDYPETFGPTWKDLEPRAGVAYDLFGNGKTALKFSANKYLAFFGAPNASTTFETHNAFTTDMNPLARLVNTTTRSWTDRNGNFVADCNILDPAAQTVTGGDICGAMANPAFGTTRSGSTYDPETLSGWNKRPDSNWQFSAGVQQEVLPRVSVDVSYFRTVFLNAIVQDDLAVGPSDFDTFSITAPSDPRLPGGGGYVVSGLTNLKPGSFGRVSDQYVTFARNYGKTINHWNGFDVTFVARPQFGLFVQGGTSTGRTSRNDCALNQALPEFVGVSGAAAANGESFCDRVDAWQTQLKLMSSYTVPRIDVQVSATVQSVPGPNITASYTATNAVVQPSLGRPLSGGAANVSVDLLKSGEIYGERMNELDLRATKTLRFGKTRTNVGVDLYNALNGNMVLTQSNSFANWQTPTRILGPRFARLVLMFDF
jgi:hypothetical protein